eukprot:403368142
MISNNNTMQSKNDQRRIELSNKLLDQKYSISSIQNSDAKIRESQEAFSQNLNKYSQLHYFNQQVKDGSNLKTSLKLIGQNSQINPQVFQSEPITNSKVRESSPASNNLSQASFLGIQRDDSVKLRVKQILDNEENQENPYQSPRPVISYKRQPQSHFSSRNLPSINRENPISEKRQKSSNFNISPSNKVSQIILSTERSNIHRSKIKMTPFLKHFENSQAQQILNEKPEEVKDFMQKIQGELEENEIYKNRRFLLKKIIADQKSQDLNQQLLQKQREQRIKILQTKLTFKQKFDKFARSIGKFFVMLKYIRIKRQRVKLHQTQVMEKMVMIALQIGRNWMLKINQNLLKNIMIKKEQIILIKGAVELDFLQEDISQQEGSLRFKNCLLRAKVLLQNIQDNLSYKQAPEPLIKFVEILLKLGVFFPEYFINQYEKDFIIFDYQSATSITTLEQKQIAVGFLIFDKILLNQVALDNGINSTMQKTFQERSFDNIKIICIVIHYLHLMTVQDQLLNSKESLVAQEFLGEDYWDLETLNSEGIQLPKFEEIALFFNQCPDQVKEIQKIIRNITHSLVKYNQYGETKIKQVESNRSLENNQ